MTAKEIGFVALAVFAVMLLLGSYTIVGSGERGVATHFGKVQEGVIDEGLHFKLPFVTTVHKIPVRVQKSDIRTEAASKDLQSVHTEFNINWHPASNEVNALFQDPNG